MKKLKKTDEIQIILIVFLPFCHAVAKCISNMANEQIWDGMDTILVMQMIVSLIAYRSFGAYVFTAVVHRK